MDNKLIAAYERVLSRKRSEAMELRSKYDELNKLMMDKMVTKIMYKDLKKESEIISLEREINSIDEERKKEKLRINEELNDLALQINWLMEKKEAM